MEHKHRTNRWKHRPCLHDPVSQNPGRFLPKFDSSLYVTKEKIQLTSPEHPSQTGYSPLKNELEAKAAASPFHASRLSRRQSKFWFDSETITTRAFKKLFGIKPLVYPVLCKIPSPVEMNHYNKLDFVLFQQGIVVRWCFRQRLITKFCSIL